MATKLYLPSTGTPSVSPDMDPNWETTTPYRLKPVTSKISSAMTNFDIYADATGLARQQGRLQYVYGPLVGGTPITGYVDGQCKCYENSTSLNATWAMSIRVMYESGGTWYVRGTCLALTAGTPTAAPPEFTTTATNRRFRNASNAVTPTLTNVTPQSGDYLVIEMGIQEINTLATRYGRLIMGDNSATDLGSNDTDTGTYNPWINFSTTLPPLQVPIGLAGTAGISVSPAAAPIRVQRGLKGNMGGAVGKNFLPPNFANGCENGTTESWQGGGTFAVDSSNQYSGTYCCKHTTTGTGDGFAAWSSPYYLPVTASTNYVYSMRLKNQGTERVQINLWDSGMGWLSMDFSDYTATSPNYQFASEGPLSDASGAYITIDIVPQTAGTNVSYFDESQFESGGSPTAWEDPAQTGGIKVGGTAALTVSAGPTLTPLAGTAGIQTGATGFLRKAANLKGSAAISVADTGFLDVARKFQGVAGITTTDTGTLRVKRGLKATAGITTGLSAVLRVARRLAGSAAITTTDTGNLKVSKRFQGSAAITTGSSGLLDVALKLKGTTSIVTTSQGTSRVLRRLSGTSTITTGGTANLERLIRISGTAGITTGLSGFLRVSKKFAGTSAISTGSSGLIDLALSLKGTVAITTTSQGTSRVARRLSGTAAITTGSSGTLKNVKLLQGTAGISTGANATLRVSRRLSGVAAISTGTTGFLKAARRLQGIANTVINTPNAPLRISRRLASTIGIVTGSSGNLRLSPVRLSGSSQISTGSTGTLRVNRELSGTASISVGATGTLTKIGVSTLNGRADITTGATASLRLINLRLQAQAGITLGATGFIKAVRPLQGTSTINVGGTAALSKLGLTPLAGSAGIQTGISKADLKVSRRLLGTAALTTSTSGFLRLKRLLAAAASITLTPTGTLRTTRGLKGTAAITTTTTATLRPIRGLKGSASINVTTLGAIETPKALSGISQITVATTARIELELRLSGNSAIITSTSANLSLLFEKLVEAKITPNEPRAKITTTNPGLIALGREGTASFTARDSRSPRTEIQGRQITGSFSPKHTDED